MLVLSRKCNEGIVFDGPGRVVVVAIRGDKVRLGFEVDKSVTVHRQEVWDAISSASVASEYRGNGIAEANENIAEAIEIIEMENE